MNEQRNRHFICNNRLINCFTKICTLAIALALLVSVGVIYDASLLPGGTVNPFSVIVLLYCKISKNPDIRVIFLSLILTTRKHKLKT